MPHYKDLTGRRFGRLVVLSVIEASGGSSKTKKWMCLCDCGNTVEVFANHLVHNRTKSCGCYHKEKASEIGKVSAKFMGDKYGGRNFIDLTGQRFGRLIVISRAPNAKDGRVQWNCICDCGNKKIIRSKPLICGATISCGCYAKEKTREIMTTHGLSDTAAYRELKRLKKFLLDTDWSKKMEKELKRFQPECVVCGGTDRLSTDHVLPMDKWNGLKPGNAVRLCVHCNSQKNNRDLSELPPVMRLKILTAAKEFEDYWKNLTNS